MVGYDSLHEAAECLLMLLDGLEEEVRNTFVVTVDLRATNKVLIEEFKQALAHGRARMASPRWDLAGRHPDMPFTSTTPRTGRST